MSIFRAQKTVINDASCLVDTLTKLGYKNVENHEEVQKLTGSPIAESQQTANMANVIVRMKDNPTLYGDLGFIKQEDGTYGIVTRMYVERKDGKYQDPATWMKQFSPAYGEAKARKIAKKNGWQLIQNKQVDGKTKMQFKVTA